MKKSYTKIIILLLISIFVLSGCKIGGIKKVYFKNYESADSQSQNGDITVENSNYRLQWIEESKRIIFTDIKSGRIYSTVPAGLDPAETETLNTQLLSDIIVEYIDFENNLVASIGSYDGAVLGGKVYCQKTKDGFKVNYCFDNEQIAVPVEYILGERGITVSLNPTEICENDKGIYRVSLAPYLCAINNKSEDSYLLVPSGSGALIKPGSNANANQIYSQEIYGKDPSVEQRYSSSAEQAIKLPVFGMKEGNKGICTIISDGAEAASIEALKGAHWFGYSSVYATFQIRSYSSVRSFMFGSISFNDLYSDGPIETECAIDIIPLSEDKANYSGIAETFRNMVFENSQAEYKDTDLNLIIYGGIMTKDSFLGVPYDTLCAATTLEQAEEMIEELSKETKTSMSVMLKGFGSTGLDKGELGGGFTVNSKLGSKKELFGINNYCKENNIAFYFDFDLICKKLSAWRAFNGTAKNLNNQTAYQYHYDKALRSQIESERYVLSSRADLFENAQKLLNKTEKWDLSGVALDSMGKIAYSDNSETKYMVKNRMSEDIDKIFTEIGNSGKRIAVLNANFYAAKKADVIFEAPSSSNKNDMFFADVPFYQMVFRGKVPMTSAAINSAADQNKAILQAVESGTGITWALYNQYDTKLTDSYYPVFNTGVYKDIKQTIVNESERLKDYYKAIKGASILEHNILENSVRQTVFDNGVEVLVNYSDKDVVIGSETVPAEDFILKID